METEEVKGIQKIDINTEMREAYLQYSMSVIVGRALPDVRDGLKPVHRRILYAMHDLGNYHNKAYKKSARVVGDVIGKYHPHGDNAVYDAMVRMAQDFSLRYPLVDGQGNFGSVDGDSPAAQRYTEVRMTKLAELLLEDINKKTVSFSPNYDDTLLIPDVLPSKIPNLLVNGSSGIAVGMATNIPPHNLSEVIDAAMMFLSQETVSDQELLACIKGPDFPTGGIVEGKKGLVDAYLKGRGIFTIKAVCDIEEMSNGKSQIIVTELPYQVNKARLIEGMADLVRNKKVEGISDLRDESSREGMRVVIQIKRGENPQVILNQLYKYTQLKVSFGTIMLALNAQHQPKVFTLRETIEAFLNHREDVITRRCLFDLKKAQDKEHILEGLQLALDSIDRVIAIIRGSKQNHEAKLALIKEFKFTEIQSQSILEMKLQRLTGLEREKLAVELSKVRETITWLKGVLSDPEKVKEIIKEELTEIKDKNKSPRRTQIVEQTDDLEIEDLIANEEMVLVMTQSGNVKRLSPSEYRLQNRGGKGLKGSGSKDEDFIAKIISSTTHTTFLVFSNLGKVYWMKGYNVPQGSRLSRGKSIRNVVQLNSSEEAQALLPVAEFSKEKNILLTTFKGTIKRMTLDNFKKPRPSGLIAIAQDLEDALVGAVITDGNCEIFIASHEGMCIRFKESDVRVMSRVARGVRGMKLSNDDYVVGFEAILPDEFETHKLLVVTENGYGKRAEIGEYRLQSRSGVGVITHKITDKVGKLVSMKKVSEKDQIIVTTNEGQVIKMKASDISVYGRATQGVRLINLKDEEKVTSVTVLGESEESSDEIE